MLGIRTLLYPTDFSPLSRRAFEVACSIAQDYRAQLLLLHVHEPPVPMGELVPTEPPEIRDYLLRELKSLETPADIAVDRQRSSTSSLSTIPRKKVEQLVGDAAEYLRSP
jgi:nucleotide-binding universal stress UspA family protein